MGVVVFGHTRTLVRTHTHTYTHTLILDSNHISRQHSHTIIFFVTVV